jgi:hypothetical protein
MARNTELVEGKHLLKPSAYAGRVVIGFPRALATEAGMDGSMFVGAMVVGKCLIVARVNNVQPEPMAEELARIFEKAIAEWEKEKP